MTVLHSIAEFAAGGVAGIQATQRDWSPFVAHFTSYKAMKRFRRAISQGSEPSKLAQSLERADEVSWGVVQQIGGQAKLYCSSPSAKAKILPCVCLSECTLPGLISLAERYGRFGFVFEKNTLFYVGARPCVYVDRDVHRRIREVARQSEATAEDQLLSGLANRYVPPGAGSPVQDFTHEREWRIFTDLDLVATPPLLFVCPERHLQDVRRLFGDNKTYIPIEALFRWGS